jgi:hypothetical protein
VSAWTWAWAGWAVYFTVVEGLALANAKPGDSLSEHVWLWLGVDRDTVGTDRSGRHPTGWTRLRRFAVLAFLAWLVAHLLTGGYF